MSMLLLTDRFINPRPIETYRALDEYFNKEKGQDNETHKIS